MFSKFFSTSVILALLAEDCTRTDTVRSGDTCDKICNRDHVSYHQLRVYNPWINDACSNLHPGNHLCLAKKAADCTELYSVKHGDVCWKIAQNHHISLDVFLYNNGLTKACDNLRDTQVVCVAHDKIHYPTSLLD